MHATHIRPGVTLPPMLAESREFHSNVLFNQIYDLKETAPHSSPRREMLSHAAARAVSLLERRRSEARKVRYAFVSDGPFRVVMWIEQYDGRDAITGYAAHTVARFATYEHAERFLECEYTEQDVYELRLEIKGPYCEVRRPLFPPTGDDNELPF